MASGDEVVRILAAMPPAADYATQSWRAGGSTPAENFPVWLFITNDDIYLDLWCRLQGYDGGGLTFTLPWSAATATSGTVRWGVAIRYIAYDLDDVDSSHSYDFNEVDDEAPGTSGYITNPTIAFSTGADMDSWVDGTLAMIRVYRHGTHANDDLSDTAQLYLPRGLET